MFVCVSALAEYSSYLKEGRWCYIKRKKYSPLGVSCIIIVLQISRWRISDPGTSATRVRKVIPACSIAELARVGKSKTTPPPPPMKHCMPIYPIQSHLLAFACQLSSHCK